MYSQNEEEIHILRACEKAERRNLLDIGAFHPTVFSNSRALIEAGWSAVLVEPSPGPMRNLLSSYGARPDIELVQAGITPGTDPLMQMHITDDAVSSADPAVIEKWKSAGGFFGKLWVPCIPLHSALERWGPFDFVNIDAEGISLALFEALLATEMFPRCICMEHDGEVARACMAAQARSYRLMYTSQENLVFSL